MATSQKALKTKEEKKKCQIPLQDSKEALRVKLFGLPQGDGNEASAAVSAMEVMMPRSGTFWVYFKWPS